MLLLSTWICLCAELDDLCSVQLGDRSHGQLWGPKVIPEHQLPSALPFLVLAVLGMGLHCRCWLRKRGRMQSHRVCLEEGSHRRLLPCVVWQEPAGNRAVLGSCWGSCEGWFCLCSISWRGWQSRGQESTELQDR